MRSRFKIESESFISYIINYSVGTKINPLFKRRHENSNALVLSSQKANKCFSNLSFLFSNGRLRGQVLNHFHHKSVIFLNT